MIHDRAGIHLLSDNQLLTNLAIEDGVDEDIAWPNEHVTDEEGCTTQQNHCCILVPVAISDFLEEALHWLLRLDNTKWLWLL